MDKINQDRLRLDLGTTHSAICVWRTIDRMSVPELADYKSAKKALTMATLAQRHLPRGRGAVPRLLGKVAGRKPRFLTTRHGAQLVMAASAWDVYATMAICGGAWDYHDFEWCVNGIPDSGTFYDVGANVGYFSVEMACCLGSAVRVVAFEPQADLAGTITQSARLNDMVNVQVIQAIVGDTSRRADLYLAPATIHASAVLDSGRGSIGVSPAEMVSIDDLVETSKIPPPDLVKMDVEGSEHLVLRGAHRTFRAHQPHVLLEYIAQYDVGERVRREVEQLRDDCPLLQLYGHAPRGSRPHPWFRIKADMDWPLCDSLFLRNSDRPVRDPGVFEP
jgi:FkbM family methyltransferase